MPCFGEIFQIAVSIFCAASMLYLWAKMYMELHRRKKNEL